MKGRLRAFFRKFQHNPKEFRAAGGYFNAQGSKNPTPDGGSRMLTPVPGHNAGPQDHHAQIIHRERQWLHIPGWGSAAPGRTRITASRWVGHAGQPDEHRAEIEAECHVVGIALQPTPNLTFYAAGKLIHSGRLPRGSMRVNQPGQPMRGIFHGAYDVLHLHVPNAVIADHMRAECPQTGTCRLAADHLIVDPVIERLASSLIHAEALGGAFGQSYADGISLAITAQLFGGHGEGAACRRPRVSGLSKWRLKRATEFMAANLAETISLADMAAATGLSRMHFAAQFRVATGMRPHEYLLQRRIERAQDLLLNSRTPLVEIALDVGFKTQAHFTTVFARLVGETPNVWRHHNDRVSEMPVPLAA
jgi:AraC family transcriptional regulator